MNLFMVCDKIHIQNHYNYLVDILASVKTPDFQRKDSSDLCVFYLSSIFVPVCRLCFLSLCCRVVVVVFIFLTIKGKSSERSSARRIRITKQYLL